MLPLDSIGYEVYSNLIYAIILIFAILSKKFLSKNFHETDSLIRHSKTKNRSKKLWIRLLRENKQLDNYLVEFNQIQKNENLKGSYSYPLIAGGVIIFLYLILIILFESIFDFWHSMAYVFLVLNIFSFITTLLIMQYMYLKLIDYDQIYSKSEIIVNLIDATKFYIFSGNVIYLLILLLIRNKLKFRFPTDDILLINIFEIAFALAIVAYYYLMRARKDFIYFIKNAINKEISNNCPHITITTNEREIAGNIINIFDDETIVLDDKGYKSIAKWVDIVGCKYLRK